jgi:ABC-type multidrug transport system ATPase subunit
MSGLDPEQRDVLRDLLAKLAEHEGLTSHAHPGYRTWSHDPK